MPRESFKVAAGFASSIFHPTDFSPPSRVAFAHALRLGVAQKGELCIMHIGRSPSDTRWSAFPRVRTRLTRWGMLPQGSPKAAVAALGLSVEKILAPPGKPITKILHHLERRPADLIVLATHQRSGPARWMYEAIAEPVARASSAMTLFVPPGTSGFVGYEDGKISLQRILVPVDHVPPPASAVRAAAALCEQLGIAQVAFTLLHVGSRKSVPKVDPPVREGYRWRLRAREGDVVEEILSAAEENGAELVVMVTQGHKGFLDALRGSTTERIVRSAKCPILAVPLDH